MHKLPVLIICIYVKTPGMRKTEGIYILLYTAAPDKARHFK